MAPKQSALRARLLDILASTPPGLAFEDVVARLTDEGSVSSQRGIRDLLNEMADEGEILRVRQPRRAPGAPPYRYFHPAFAPPARSELDQALERSIEGAVASVSTRDALEQQALRPDESIRQSHGMSVLMRIAHGMLADDVHAVALVEHATDVSALEPVQLVIDFAEWVARDINTLTDETIEHLNAGRAAEVEHCAAELDARLSWARRYFHGFWRLDRGVLGSQAIFDIPRSAMDCHHSGKRAALDLHLARERLNLRVLGSRVAELVKVDTDVHSIAAGTDASVADIRIERQAAFAPAALVSVMSAAAALVQRADGATKEYQDFDIFPDQLHQLADQTAAARGFILSPMLRDSLPERDFRHSRMAALELRQYDEEFRIVVREAKWRPVGSSPSLGVDPRPTLIFRDGRTFPLVHRLRDYESTGLYGQIVRNQIEKFSQILHHTFSGPSGEVVYGAVVKSPEMSWLAPLVFWHLYRSGAIVRGRRVIADAADVYRPPFADSAVAHLLFTGLSSGAPLTMSSIEGQSQAYRTCIAMRRFVDTAFDEESLPVMVSEALHRRPVDENSEADWLIFLGQRSRETEEREREAPLPISLYRPFVYLCSRAAVAMTYGAPASLYDPFDDLARGEAGQFLIPRLEAAVDMREPGRSTDHLHAMIGWMASGGAELTRRQSNESAPGEGNALPVLVPDVIALAHDVALFAKGRLTEEVQDDLREKVARLRQYLNRPS